MIGQKNLTKLIKYLISQKGTFSRFSIFVGSRGSEKNKMANYVADQLQAICVEVPDCKVETIRDMITAAYKVTTLTVYNIKDADLMSIQARNALLKVTEEPPNKAYFVMTLEDLNNTLPTIKSRGVVYMMENYTSEELATCVLDKEERSICLELCETPGDIDLLRSYKAVDFYKWVTKVVDNIAEVSGSNAFKIAQSIKFKDSDEGYDLILFWKAVCVVCIKNGFFYGHTVTSKYLAKAAIKSINKQMLFDRWILDIREEWRDGSK